MKLVACVVVVVLVGVHAAAADDAARARAADRSARAHYAAQEYDAAIADYQTAYEAMPDPLFLFDIAQAFRQLHDCDHALAFYRDYLQQRPDADNRELVAQFIEQMAECATPEPAPKPRAPADRPPQPAAPPLSSHTLRLAGIASATLGVVLLSTAVYFSEQASSEASQLEAACVRGCSGASVRGIDQAGLGADHNAIATYALGGTALAAGVAAILWTVLRAPGEPAVVAPVPGGATVSARLHF